jgi:hypothetical protein
MTSRALGRWQSVHTWSSLACTLFLLMLCITGLPLIFSQEIEDAASTPLPARSGVAARAPWASLDMLVRTARDRYPDEVVRFVFIDDDEPRAKVVMAAADSPDQSKDHRIEFDLRTAEVVADTQPGGALSTSATTMGWLLRLHTDLLAGFAGEMTLAVVGLVIVLALVSGVVLYASYMRKLAFGAVRTRTWRMTWLDRHNLLGVCVLVWALVVGLTGVVNELSKPLSDHWRRTDMSALLRGHQGQTVTSPRNPAQSAFVTVRAALAGRNVTSLIFPSRPFSNPHHYLVWTNGNTPLTHRLFTAALVDAQTGELTAVAQMPAYLRAVISYERRRAAWSKICEVIISSSAPVRDEGLQLRRTVSGEPIAEHDSTESSIDRSGGPSRSSSRTGGFSLVGRPLRRLTKACCIEVARKCASASVSAANTLKPSITYGLSSCADGGRWRGRARSPASSSAARSARRRRTAGRGAAASWAPNRLEPRIHTGTSRPAPGTARTWRRGESAK